MLDEGEDGGLGYEFRETSFVAWELRGRFSFRFYNNFFLSLCINIHPSTVMTIAEMMTATDRNTLIDAGARRWRSKLAVIVKRELSIDNLSHIAPSDRSPSVTQSDITISDLEEEDRKFRFLHTLSLLTTPHLLILI